LEARYEVLYYDWWAHGVIEPKPGDVLLGHPHPHPDSIFSRSLQRSGWRRRLMLAPFAFGDLRQFAFEDSIVPKCDLFLAITGPYWFGSVESSPCSHWRPKMIHLDMAVDRGHYPPLKDTFGPPGKRRVVYLGHTGRGKNTGYLSEIASLLPDVEFAWIGRGSRPIRGLEPLGFIDYDSPASRELLARFDFMLTVGNADANPTTILEAMAWGLIPVCTPTSGYAGIPSIPNVPVGDAPKAAARLRQLLDADEADLLAMQSANRRLLDEHYNWDRFAAQVIEAIESSESPALSKESLKRRLTFTYYNVTSPHGPIAYGPPGRLLGALQAKMRRARARLAAAMGRRTGLGP
jgi:glycosyltransferase involved in cell wall biosynthesis